MKLGNIVVGTDFSEPAARALDVALEIAARTHAQITLVHVVELADDLALDAAIEAATRALHREAAARGGAGVALVAVVRRGRPWEKLENVAIEVGAELIVLGRQGAGGAALQVGSVVERVLRASRRAVLTIGSDDRWPRVA